MPQVIAFAVLAHQDPEMVRRLAAERPDPEEQFRLIEHLPLKEV